MLDWADYFCYAEEFAESTGSRHSQFYVFTKKKKTLAGLSKLLTEVGYKGAHVETAHGTHEEAIVYCEGPYEKKDVDGNVIKFKPKNDTFKEYGERPLESGEKTKTDWDKVRTLARQGRFEEIDARYDVCFTRNLRFLHQEARRAQHLDEPCGYFIYGKSGAGKSFYARMLNGNNDEDTYLKNFNKYWCGYKGEDLVILEDADPSKVKGLDQELKIWTDRYAFAPENKGGHTGKIRPKKVVITSQYRLRALFPDIETYYAIKRRCITIYAWTDKDGAHQYKEYPRMGQAEIKAGVIAEEDCEAIAPSFVMTENEKVDPEFWSACGQVAAV